MDYLPLWGWWNPQSWAPQNLTQPIQPGWTFGNVITVNEANSSSPQTEHRIVAEQSYGRQIGDLMDAVATLIEERPKELPGNQAFDKLIAMRERIEEIKSRSTVSRLQRLEAELAWLKSHSPEEYRRLVSG